MGVSNRYLKFNEIFGNELLNHPIESSFDFIPIATKGLKATSILNFNIYFKRTKAFTAHLLNLSEPTLYRLLKSNSTLKRNYSIQLLELADLFIYGIEVLGDETAFFNWLEIPNIALGGIEPRNLLELPEGINKVRTILGRIEYGIYS